METTTTSRTINCLGQVNQGSWCQETYETATRDAGLRARQLRKAGYTVTVSGMGHQVTPLGSMYLTMVDIRPGANADTTDLPTVNKIDWPR